MHHQGTHISQPLRFYTSRGQFVSVRQARAADTLLLSELLGRLSERTRRLRYMRSGYFSAEALWDEAMRMTQERPGDHTTFVATIRPNKHDQAVAVAELARGQHDLTVGEIAIVVRDDQQRQGIGTFLLWQLIGLAQRSGITALSADMLAENSAMLGLIRALELPYTAMTRYGETQILLQVPRSPRRSLPPQTNNQEPLDDGSRSNSTTPHRAWLMRRGVTF